MRNLDIFSFNETTDRLIRVSSNNKLDLNQWDIGGITGFWSMQSFMNWYQIDTISSRGRYL